jgi:proteic killer suppression protein
VIQSFASRETERLFRDGVSTARWRAIESVALRKLDMLDAAVALGDLRSPPGNRRDSKSSEHCSCEKPVPTFSRNALEALKGSRRGQWSIRINDQWRICFRWIAEGPTAVEIVDYH